MGGGGGGSDGGGGGDGDGGGDGGGDGDGGDGYDDAAQCYSSKVSVYSVLCALVGVTQCDTTPYHAHAHKCYSNYINRSYSINLLNRVPEHDCLTFFVLHRTKCK